MPPSMQAHMHLLSFAWAQLLWCLNSGFEALEHMSFDSFYKGICFRCCRCFKCSRSGASPFVSGSRILIDDQSCISSLHTSREGEKNPSQQHCNVLNSQYAPASITHQQPCSQCFLLSSSEGCLCGMHFVFTTAGSFAFRF